MHNSHRSLNCIDMITMERKLGEVFEYNGINLCVEERSDNCNGCHFYSDSNDFCFNSRNIIGKCHYDSRSDRINVKFIKINNNMEERVIKLSLEKAKEFYKKGGEFKDLALSAYTEKELKEVMLPETWKEFCKLYNIHFPNEYFIDPNSNIAIFPGGLGRDVNSCKNLLPTLETVEAHLALMQLHQLRDCYRQGWVPDWSDDDYKYCIINVCNTPNIVNCINYNRFLSFQSKEIAEKFLTNFRELIEKAGDLI